MTDAMNKVPELRELLAHCKAVVTKLHFKADMVQQEMEKLKNVEMANDIIDKVAEAFKVLELEQNVSLESENTQLSDVCEMDNDEQESINISQQKQNIADGVTHVKQYRRLRQEVVTW